MVALTEVRASNTALKTLSPGLVAIFVGGTSGIGLYTAREFVRNTQSPRVYLVGRNETEASKIIPELEAINESSKVEFIKSDVSLLKNVDQVCKDIQTKESKVNLLFMTVGYFTMNGKRDETAEGLDRKFSLHYYARTRFTQNLLPLLEAAANDPDPKRNLSRVVSVLDPQPGRIFAPNFQDLDLKHNFSLKNCATHATAMINFSHEHFAAVQPGTSFVHAFPSIVATNGHRELGAITKPLWGVLAAALKPFSVDIKESGERHLFAATAQRFAPKGKTEGVEGLAKGNDEVVGSGSYAVSWNGEVFGESKKAAGLRSEGAVNKIWKHTEEVFQKISSDGKY
jgi:hypothetical protein